MRRVTLVMNCCIFVGQSLPNNSIYIPTGGFILFIDNLMLVNHLSYSFLENPHSMETEKFIFSRTHRLFSGQIAWLVSFSSSKGGIICLLLLSAWLLIVGPAPLAVSYPSPCALSFLPTQVCEGRALQLITDLPVEFHCNKGSYSCRQDGEKPALAAELALLRGVSKMKRLDFEARHQVYTESRWYG